MAKGKILKTVIDISGEISPTLGKSLQTVTDKLEGVNVKALAVGASVAAIGGAVAVGVGKAVGCLNDLGTEYSKASNQMAASTGLVGDELANMEKQMQDVYANNFGESMQDVSDSMAEVYRQTGEWGDALQKTTEGAFALRDTFGYEVTESARAAKAMMTNFGISGEEAMGLIAAGAQNGLDYSGELIDSINEYSVQFSKLGFDADDMFKIFQKGAESGAWNLDKVGDAIKEFSIRSIDGSKTTTTAFTDLGLNADKMMATFAKGGNEAEYAFQTVLKKLMEVDNEVERDAIGVSLFGTQWEDLGIDAVAAMADVQGGAYDTGNALGKINDVKYNDLDSAMQGIKRTAEVALLPAAENVTEAFLELAPKIQGAVETAAPYIADLAEQLGPLLELAIDLGVQGFEFIAQKVQELAPVVGEFANGALTWIKNNMEWLIPVVSGLAAAFGAYKLISQGVAIWEGIKAAALATGTTVTGLATAATWLLNTALAFLTSPITLVVLAIGALVAAGVALYRNWDKVKVFAQNLGVSLQKTWNNIKTKVSKTFTQIGTAISRTWTNIKTKTANLWSQIVTAVTSKINSLRTKVSTTIQNIASTASSIWNNIRSTATTIWNGIVSSVSSIVSGLVSRVAGTFNNIYSSVSNVMGNIRSSISNVWNNIVSSVSGFVSNIRTTISNVFSNLYSIMAAPFNAIKGTIDNISNKVSGVINSISNAGSTVKGWLGFAAGGFTSGPSIAGEDPRYPTEAVISFNPAYRQQNLAYWAQAGRMLGADTADYMLGGGDGGTYYDLGGVTFAPNITIHGDADKQTVMQAIEDEYPEFLDMLEEFLTRRRAPQYA